MTHTLARTDIDHGEMVGAAEIRWTPGPPPPQIELLPLATLLALDHAELLVYTRGLQAELQSFRTLLHESLSALQRVTVQRDRALVVIRRQYEELRAAAAEFRAAGLRRTA